MMTKLYFGFEKRKEKWRYYVQCCLPQYDFRQKYQQQSLIKEDSALELHFNTQTSSFDALRVF